eukprot:m.92339 g.92339  ORF g.92339 m.92339 type:complete len:211 (-) comp20226_c0_seq10:2495-3127(-)
MWASSMEISNSTVPHRSHGAPTSPQPSLGRVPSLRAASARAAAIHLVQLAPKEHQKVAGRRSPLYLLTVFSDLLPSLQREILAQAVLHFGRALDPYTYEVLVDPRWRSVQLAGHLHATDGALRPFLRCRKLESIVLSGCRKVLSCLRTVYKMGGTLWHSGDRAWYLTLTLPAHLPTHAGVPQASNAAGVTAARGHAVETRPRIERGHRCS